MEFMQTPINADKLISVSKNGVKKPLIQNLAGLKFNRWNVISYVGKVGKKTIWSCRCDCGTLKDVWAGSLRNGNSKSCGCYKSEMSRARATKHGYTRGGLKSSTYNTWVAMRQRCSDPNTDVWMTYGGRGIKVCERWNDFNLFMQDMGLKPSPKMTLDRINSNGNYEPSNCRWATYRQQANNTRRNRYATISDKRMTVAQWCRELGIVKPGYVYVRMSKGWTTEAAISIPKLKVR